MTGRRDPPAGVSIARIGLCRVEVQTGSPDACEIMALLAARLAAASREGRAAEPRGR